MDLLNFPLNLSAILQPSPLVQTFFTYFIDISVCAVGLYEFTLVHMDSRTRF